MMAAAMFAGTGRIAVALGEMGPGGLNLASGAGVAFNNHLAALLITTNQHRAAAYPHRGMFMDMDTRAVFAPLTKWNAVVHDARRLPELVRTRVSRGARRPARAGAPGHSAGRAGGALRLRRRRVRPRAGALPRASPGRGRRPPRWPPRPRCCAARGGR